MIKLICTLHEVKTTRDGGGRITLEFGKDSIDAAVELQRVNSAGDVLLAVAMAPIHQGVKDEELEEFQFGDLNLTQSSEKTARRSRK